MDWKTNLTIVDITTGEQIPRHKFDKHEYDIVKIEKKQTTVVANHGTRHILWQVRPTSQQKLFDNNGAKGARHLSKLKA